jgi:methyl-accepting chemotaxis protein
MGILSWFVKLSIKMKVIFVVLLFGFIFISFYSFHSYNAEKQILTDKINHQLISAAYTVGNIFGKEFHDGITGRDYISLDQNIENTNRLNYLAKKLKIDYVYTTLLENDSVFFTSGNASEEDIKERGYEPFYFYYPDASDSLLLCFEDKKTRFEEYSDNYGTFRSVFIPFKTPSGKIFVAGADITLDEIDGLMNKVLLSNVGTGLIIFIIFLAVVYALVNVITKPIHILAEQSKQITEGNMDIEISVVAKDEIGFLSSAVKKMVESLKNTLRNLEDEKASIQERINEAIKDSAEQKEYLERSVNTLLQGMKSFSSGNLSVTLVSEKKDIINELYSGFNNTVKEFKHIIGDVKDTINILTLKSSEISSSSVEMAAGAEEQSSQTTETASAIEQVAQNIFENSRNIIMAVDNAKKAGDIAEDGGKIVANTVEGMKEIAIVVSRSAETVKKLGQSSDQIGAIIQVIDEIADQTNLLALNAAIEAARAGEMGRGFAVVADEVRNLAEKTTKATKEIAEMVKHIQRETEDAVESMNKGTVEVEKGKTLANKAGESLKEIINANVKVVDEITRVSLTSEEQSTKAEQISKSIDAIKNVTSETATGIQQMAHAAEDLNKLTENLQILVHKFKIEDRVNESHYSVIE